MWKTSTVIDSNGMKLKEKRVFQKLDLHSEISGKPHSSGFFGELEKGGKERNKMF